jgi:hypothetical protein
MLSVLRLGIQNGWLKKDFPPAVNLPIFSRSCDQNQDFDSMSQHGLFFRLSLHSTEREKMLENLRECFSRDSLPLMEILDFFENCGSLALGNVFVDLSSDFKKLYKDVLLKYANEATCEKMAQLLMHLWENNSSLGGSSLGYLMEVLGEESPHTILLILSYLMEENSKEMHKNLPSIVASTLSLCPRENVQKFFGLVLRKIAAGEIAPETLALLEGSLFKLIPSIP